MDAILDATAQVLVAEGYDRTSTNRVAERAGVSVGSIYQYFPNKEALVGELIDRYSSLIMDTVLAGMAELADAPPEAAVRELAATMVEIKRRDPRLAKVLREQIPRVGRMQRYERELGQVVDAAVAHLERWREHLRHDDLETAAFVAVHAVDAVTHAGVTLRPAAEDGALVDHVTDLVVSYLVGEVTDG